MHGNGPILRQLILPNVGALMRKYITSINSKREVKQCWLPKRWPLILPVPLIYVLKNDVDYDPEKIFERFKAEAQEREPSVSPVPNPGKETGKKPDEDGKKP